MSPKPFGARMIAPVKSVFRKAIPHYSSSEISEVIAAGSGYRTYAAMLADTHDANEVDLTYVGMLDLDKMSKRLEHISHKPENLVVEDIRLALEHVCERFLQPVIPIGPRHDPSDIEPNCVILNTRVRDVPIEVEFDLFKAWEKSEKKHWLQANFLIAVGMRACRATGIHPVTPEALSRRCELDALHGIGRSGVLSADAQSFLNSYLAMLDRDAKGEAWRANMNHHIVLATVRDILNLIPSSVDLPLRDAAFILRHRHKAVESLGQVNTKIVMPVPPAPARRPGDWLRDIGVPVRLMEDGTLGKTGRDRCEKAFIEQLGPVWTRSSNLPLHLWCLIAIFAMHNAKDDKTIAFREQIAEIWETKTDPGVRNAKIEALIEPVIKDDEAMDPMLDCADGHAYASTALMAMLKGARATAGVLAPAEFIWLKRIDRPLWYALNNVGRHAFNVEAAGTISHYFQELALRRPIPDPRVDKAIEGIEEHLRDQA